MNVPTASPDRPSPFLREPASFAHHLAQVAVVALACWSAGTPPSEVAHHASGEVEVLALVALVRIRADLARCRRLG